MSRHASIAEHVAQVPMFAACTKRELQTISKLSTQRDVPAGKTLTRQGQPGQEFVIILEGTASATRNGRRVATLGPGDYFGEIALLDPGERTATVVAETPMLIAVVTPNEFGQMIDEVPPLAHKIMRGLARQIRELAQPAATI
jgi:CRP/FNR family transcriptional regulator, cyclic AMP receptor protein